MYPSLPQSLRREQTFASDVPRLLPKRARKAHEKTSDVSKIGGALNNNGFNQTHGKHRRMLLDSKLNAELYLRSEMVASTSRMLVHPADDVPATRQGFLPIGVAVGATSSQEKKAPADQRARTPALITVCALSADSREAQRDGRAAAQ